jgi:hypothetical protein
VEKEYCMSILPRVDAKILWSDASPNVASGDTAMVFKSTDSYAVCDVAVKIRRHDLMYDKVPIVKEIGYKSVYPYLTYAYRREPIQNNN